MTTTHHFTDCTIYLQGEFIGNIRPGCGRPPGTRSPERAHDRRFATCQGRVGGRPRTEHDPRTMAKLAALKGSGASIRRIDPGNIPIWFEVQSDPWTAVLRKARTDSPEIVQHSKERCIHFGLQQPYSLAKCGSPPTGRN
jgi:hypothetical protein